MLTLSGSRKSRLRFGADDLDGTVVEEKIYHDAGATLPKFTPRAELERLIRAAGRVPVERDTLYDPSTALGCSSASARPCAGRFRDGLVPENVLRSEHLALPRESAFQTTPQKKLRA